jgi:hypothetical protein
LKALADGEGLGRKKPDLNGSQKGEDGEGQEGPQPQNHKGGVPDAEGRGTRSGMDMEDAAGRGRNGKMVRSKKGGLTMSDRAATAQRSLNSDQVQAMMNQLHLDQKRYAGAFNPTKKFDQPPPNQQDMIDEMMRQQMGLPPKPQAQDADGGGAERKDW